MADDLATMARVGGNLIHYTGQGRGQGIGMAIDAYNWINEDESDEDIQPPMGEEVYETTQGLMRRGASKSRSITRESLQVSDKRPEEGAS